MNKTKIEWCDMSWNPVTGCSKVSSGCKYCYAESMSRRFWNEKVIVGMGENAGDNHPVTRRRLFTDVIFHPDKLEQPLLVKKPKKIFVNSMSDLFHEKVDFNHILEVFKIIHLCKWHTFIILTKRPERMLDFFEWMQETIETQGLEMLADFQIHHGFENVWLGTSIEDQKTAQDRVPALLKTPAKVHFVSCEPLLGMIDLCEIRMPDNRMLGNMLSNDFYNTKIDWVICGGESGMNARPMHPFWVTQIHKDCKCANVPFFFKGWGEWIPAHTDDFYNRKFEKIDNWGTLIVSGNFYEKATITSGHQFSPDEEYATTVFKVGKKAAGNRLEGTEWIQFPGE